MRGPDTPANGRRRASQIDVPAIRAGDPPAARPEKVRRSSLADWSVSTRLVALFVMASLLGLVFGGLRIADSVGTANAYSNSAQLAAIGSQITKLAQAMEDERDLTAGEMALTLLITNATTNHAGPTVLAPLTAAMKREKSQIASAQKTTNAPPGRAEAPVQGIGSAYPASVQAKAVTVLNQIHSLLPPGRGSA